MPDSIDGRLRESLDAVALDFAANTVCDGRGDNWASGDDQENARDDATAAITAYLSASGLLTALSSLGEALRAGEALECEDTDVNTGNLTCLELWPTLDTEDCNHCTIKRFATRALAALDHPFSPGDAQ